MSFVPRQCPARKWPGHSPRVSKPGAFGTRAGPLVKRGLRSPVSLSITGPPSFGSRLSRPPVRPAQFRERRSSAGRIRPGSPSRLMLAIGQMAPTHGATVTGCVALRAAHDRGTNRAPQKIARGPSVLNRKCALAAPFAFCIAPRCWPATRLLPPLATMESSPLSHPYARKAVRP